MADGIAACTVSASTADTGIVIGDVIGMSDANATIAAVGGAGATVTVTKARAKKLETALQPGALSVRSLIQQCSCVRAKPQAGTSLSSAR